MEPFGASPLALLRAVGRRGMGALTYHPSQELFFWGAVADGLDLEQLAADAMRVDAEVSSLTALPAIECAYLAMARAAGLDVPAARVYRLRSGEDALIVDYSHLLEVARRVTKNFADVLRALRLAAFNVFAGNRDDHPRNVAFLMLPSGEWRLAPAYDLTWTEVGTGYHAMSVDGEARAPGEQHLRRIGRQAGLDATQVADVLDDVRGAVSRWGEFAEAAAVPTVWRSRIAKVLMRTTRPV